MKRKGLLLLAFAALMVASCSSVEDLGAAGDKEDSITWATVINSYYAYEWQHQEKEDTCLFTYNRSNFHVGRNSSSGRCYAKSVSGSHPLLLEPNDQEKDVCPGCSTSGGRYWFHNVTAYKYYFWWEDRRYWVTDIPESLKDRK